MKALHSKPNMKMKAMNENDRFIKKIRKEFAKFERTMEELHFLKQVSQDLKSFKEMIKLKKYD
jgi:protein subunit release factor A